MTGYMFTRIAFVITFVSLYALDPIACASSEKTHTTTKPSNIDAAEKIVNAQEASKPPQKNPIKGHLKALGLSGSRELVPELSENPSNFFESYFLKSKPVILKGAAKKSPNFAKWTDTYLGSLDDKSDVPVQIQTGKKESENVERDMMIISNFLREYNTTDLYLVDDVPTSLETDVMIPCVLQVGFGLLEGRSGIILYCVDCSFSPIIFVYITFLPIFQFSLIYCHLFG